MKFWKFLEKNRKKFKGGGELNIYGELPLPPYIKRPSKDSDKKDYQTVYASERGSVAAPTAGIHFSKPLLKKLQICYS